MALIKTFNISTPYVKYGYKKENELILKPLTHISQVQGKRTRTRLAKALNVWLKIDEEKLNIIEQMSEMFHNASLLLDDIEDSSDLRRGLPAAHSIYGVPCTVNAANYVIFQSLEKAGELKSALAVSICVKASLDIIRGQGMDIYWRENNICPTEEEYLEMITKKTGVIFLLISKLMQLFSENKKDLSKLMYLMGCFFQIRDDYLNLSSENFKNKKSFCEDLTEGKFSFPVIHAIKTQPNDQQVMDILKQRTKDDDVKKHCLSLLEEYGSLEYTKAKVDQLYKEAKEEASKFGENPEMDELLDMLYSTEE